MNTAERNRITRAYHLDDPIHLIRHRINTFLTNAARNPVITVCARTGYGKTRSVSDFLRWRNQPYLYLQLSEFDNSVAGFWENVTDGIMSIDPGIADVCREIGFPDTEAKTLQFMDVLGSDPLLIVCDDLHSLKEPAVLGFMERLVNNLKPNLKVFLIYYTLPAVDLTMLQADGLVSEINEDDLTFTESELVNCLKQQNISLDSQTVREILKDTGGWAFAVNLAVRSLKRIPKYNGFVKTRLKPNIFEFMETENWTTISDNLKDFLVRFSLADEHYAELAEALASAAPEADKDKLLDELKQQSAYITFDEDEKIYSIHHIYLDFLREKHSQLTGDTEKEA
jgi:LuxR family maltose regulon positive regulatory protein